MNFVNSKDNDLKNIVSKEITTLKQFEDLVVNIEEYFLQRNEKMHFYYRGDSGKAKLAPEIINSLEEENLLFDSWITKNNNCDYCEKCDKHSFECLANMQHYGSRANEREGDFTRLIDFTLDSKVALRFACGKKEKVGNRYISIYVSNYKIIDSTDKKIDEYMKLVNDDYISDEKRKKLRNCFVEFRPSKKNKLSERMKRQKAVFLLCGQDKKSKEKSISSLTEENGRGKEYEGYFYILEIKNEYINGIREELENKYKEYSMKYLLVE